jgi:PadR family transcriptional regulator PadR
MISNLNSKGSIALLESVPHRKYLEKLESDLVRGIGKICILKIIKNYGKDGVYGYQLFKDIEQLPNNILKIKDGTLYPLLRNLENWEYKEKDPNENKEKHYTLSLLQSTRKIVEDRPRKYYYLTKDGEKILAFMEGFFKKLLESISALNDFKINIDYNKYIFCKNCNNQVDISSNENQNCEICGFNPKKDNLEDE